MIAVSDTGPHISLLRYAGQVYAKSMQVTVNIPDDLASQLIPAGQDPARAVLEDALVQAYRENRISGHQLMTALGIETRYELDGFLKARQVWIEYSLEELERDRATMERILSEKSKKRV
jgi:hypothetical protein